MKSIYPISISRWPRGVFIFWIIAMSVVIFTGVRDLAGLWPQQAVSSKSKRPVQSYPIPQPVTEWDSVGDNDLIWAQTVSGEDGNGAIWPNSLSEGEALCQTIEANKISDCYYALALAYHDPRVLEKAFRPDGGLVFSNLSDSYRDVLGRYDCDFHTTAITKDECRYGTALGISSMDGTNDCRPINDASLRQYCEKMVGGYGTLDSITWVVGGILAAILLGVILLNPILMGIFGALYISLFVFSGFSALLWGGPIISLLPLLLLAVGPIIVAVACGFAARMALNRLSRMTRPASAALL